jgi:type IV pilus assembly protein PilW
MRNGQMRNPLSLRSRARGYNLIEVMIAIAVAVFLLAGIVMIEQGTKQTSIAQTGLAQLQDDERIAMTILANVIQQAGYYPIPTTAMDKHQLELSLPKIGAMIDGQSIYGQRDADNNDTLTIRFLTNPNDGVLNCQGGSNTTAAQVEYDNVFTVDLVNHQLTCAINGKPAVVLVDHVKSMHILYGVFSQTVTQFDNGGSVDTFDNANQFSLETTTPPAFWTNVYTVKITLEFFNPLKGQPGQPETISITRVIPLKSRTGVNV